MKETKDMLISFEMLILDDLSSPGKTVLESYWEFFIDHVMGGRPSGKVAFY